MTDRQLIATTRARDCDAAARRLEEAIAQLGRGSQTDAWTNEARRLRRQAERYRRLTT